MKNAKAILVTLAVSAFMFGACGEKCITCTYTVPGADPVVQETCGSQEVRDAAELVAETAAIAAGVTATCE